MDDDPGALVPVELSAYTAEPEWGGAKVSVPVPPGG